MSALAYLAALVVFVLVAFGLTPLTPSIERELAVGLALVALGLVLGSVPRSSSPVK